jgi:hypothetical protein
VRARLSDYPKVCVNGIPYETNLDQLEADGVTASLALHELPSSEANLFYRSLIEDPRRSARPSLGHTHQPFCGIWIARKHFKPTMS